MTTASIPFFRITDRGYVRLRTGEQVGLFIGLARLVGWLPARLLQKSIV